jgi:hypothetical protein
VVQFTTLSTLILSNFLKYAYPISLLPVCLFIPFLLTIECLNQYVKMPPIIRCVCTSVLLGNGSVKTNTHETTVVFYVACVVPKESLWVCLCIPL